MYRETFNRICKYSIPAVYAAGGVFGLLWAAKFTTLAAYDALAAWLQ